MNLMQRIGLTFLVLGSLAGYLWYLSRADSEPFYMSFQDMKHEKNIVPIAIIGSGPAGLSAALYGARAGLHTVVFMGPTPGGQLTSTTYVENWPGIPKMLGPKIMEQTRKQAETFGALMIADTVTQVDFSRWPYTLKTDEGHTVKALSVIIATGSNPRMLGVPGEKEYWGSGVTACAVCDAPFYKDKDVVVIGGGDSAVEEATILTSYANKVTMLVRGPKLRAAAAMQARLKDYPKIEVRYTTNVTHILGNGVEVTGVQLFNNKTKQSTELKTDGVFLAVGHTPNTELVKKWIYLDNDGYIQQLCDERTYVRYKPGVYAAGDVADKRYRQAGVAAGRGIQAALDAIEFVQKRGLPTTWAKKLEKNYFDPDLQSNREGPTPLPKS